MCAWRGVGLLAALAALAACLPMGARAETPASDPRAVAVADRVMAALGGKQRWDALRGLRWTFGSEVRDTVRSSRRHAWDKHTGWHRVEGTNRQGQRFRFVHDLDDTTSGKAWIDGVAIEGDSLGKLLRNARALWTNDTYWFLMPYKLRDPGVTLGYAGEVREGGCELDRIALGFQNVGLTPGDHYWVYVDRKPARVVRWEYVLEGQRPPPVVWTWEGWEEHAGLWFPTAHRQEGRNVFTRDVEAVMQFPPDEFTAAP